MTRASEIRRQRRRLGVPPRRKIAHIKINDELKRVEVVTNNVLLNQLHRDGPVIRKSFDRLAADDLSETSRLLGQTMGLLIPHLPRVNDEDMKAVCARLISSAISSFIASVEVARHGYRRQYGSCARPVLEVITTILYLEMHHGALDQFLAGKLDTRRTIAPAKKVLPPIGQLWGVLSNDFVHISPSHARFEPVRVYQRGEEPLVFIGSVLRVTAWMIYVVAELVFHDEVESPRYWHHHGGREFSFSPSDDERKWLSTFFETYLSEENEEE